VDKAYSEASDAWSFGVLLWEMVTGRVPWEEEEALQVAMRVGKEGHTLPVPPGCDEVLAELMVSCWEQDPARRYTSSSTLACCSCGVANQDRTRSPKLNERSQAHLRRNAHTAAGPL
jgi:serine/threonine protein kinase